MAWSVETSAELQGGDFGSGFAGAAFAKFASGQLPADINIAAGTTITAVIGGTVSRITGGKFANGAVTAAFGYLFNAQLSKQGAEYFRENAIQGNPPLAGPIGLIGRFFRVIRGFFGLQKSLTVNELVSGSRFLRESDELLQLQRSGGASEANRVFDTIDRAGDIIIRQTPNGAVRSIDLPGGGTASVRGFSSGPVSRPTIQIDSVGARTIKIRFED